MSGFLGTAELYDPSAATWTPTGALVQPRLGHTATLLADGRVLVAGGENEDGDTLGSAEVYDASAGTWSAIADLTLVRSYHAATRLANGRVLLTGGTDDDRSPAEVYDPSTGAWSLVDNMAQARSDPTATLLSDGRVLVLGGWNEDMDKGMVRILDSAEIYDPSANKWTPAGNMGQARAGHTATLIEEGRVLVVGGARGIFAGLVGSLDSAEIYDPSTNTWSTTGSLALWRHQHRATQLADGAVLVVGGRVSSPVERRFGGHCGPSGPSFWLHASAEVFDASNGVWLSRDPAPPQDIVSC